MLDYAFAIQPDFSVMEPSISQVPLFQNPWGDVRDYDVYSNDSYLYKNPYGDLLEADYYSVDCSFLKNPYGDMRELFDEALNNPITVFPNPSQQQSDTMDFNQNHLTSDHYMFNNSYKNGTGFDLDMAHDMGLMTDEQFAFMETMFPKPHHNTYHMEPVEVRPIIGPSKSDWEDFDRHEAARSDAVDKYHECIKKGELDEASKWADKARKEQYAKESIYEVGYVTDIDKRAGLY